MKLGEAAARAGVLTKDKTDVPFMHVIFTDQVASVARYISHDATMNLKASVSGVKAPRPHGSPKEESNAYGHALLWLLALAQRRGVDIEAGFASACAALEQRDWEAKEAADPDSVTGLVACEGEAVGTVVVGSWTPADLRYTTKRSLILMVEHATPDLAAILPWCAAVATNHGGMTCHAAILCREAGIPCIVGTGNATKLLKDGQRVCVTCKDGVGSVEVLE